MARYIDADKIPFCEWTSNGTCMRITLKEAIDDIPAADVRPERYGQWEVAGDGDIQCGKCGANYKAREIIPRIFCPCCGAKMDGEDGGNNDG